MRPHQERGVPLRHAVWPRASAATNVPSRWRLSPARLPTLPTRVVLSSNLRAEEARAIAKVAPFIQWWRLRADFPFNTKLPQQLPLSAS